MRRASLLHRIAHARTDGLPRGVVSLSSLTSYADRGGCLRSVLFDRLNVLLHLGLLQIDHGWEESYFALTREGQARLTCECFGGAK